VAKNWGGNLDYGPGKILAPESLAELSEIIRSGKVRPIGTKHSFSNLVIGEGQLVSAAGLSFEPVIDQKNSTVTVPAATKYGELAVFLEEEGYALKNMGSLPHISIAGSAATGTHGSGDKNQILSSSLVSFSYLDANGVIVTLNRSSKNFEACRVGLGAYGLWVNLTLAIVQSYQMRQDVFRNLPWELFLEDPAKLTAAGYSVSLFTKWGSDTIDQTWVKSRSHDSAPPIEIAGIKPDSTSMPELMPGVGDNLTQQGGEEGAWLDRLPHFRFDATPSAGNEIQTEYFFERKNIVGAIKAIQTIASEINPTLLISEIRTIAQDAAWLSPMLRGDSVAVHFTWVNDAAAVAKAVALVEKATAEFKPIPHWGKVHGFSAEKLREVHPKLDRAKALFDSLDPQGVFSTDYLMSLGIRS
jgi:xylitol oxidase